MQCLVLNYFIGFYVEGKCVVPVSQEPSRPPLILKEEKHDKRDDDSSKLAMKLLLSLELLRIIDEVKEESRKGKLSGKCLAITSEIQTEICGL